jgi:predicted DNA-binding transcriptional regulator AlpA
MADAATPEFLTPQEVVKLLRLKTPRTLDKWHRKGFGPPKIKVTPKVVLYARAALLEWITSHSSNGSDPHNKPHAKRGRPRKAAP